MSLLQQMSDMLLMRFKRKHKIVIEIYIYALIVLKSKNAITLHVYNECYVQTYFSIGYVVLTKYIHKIYTLNYKT